MNHPNKMKVIMKKKTIAVHIRRSLPWLMILTLIVLAKPDVKGQWFDPAGSVVDYKWQSVVYGGSPAKFVSVGRPVSGQPNGVMTSDNGLDWTFQNYNSLGGPDLGNVNMNDVIFAEGIFVAVSSDFIDYTPFTTGQVYWSENGITWNLGAGWDASQNARGHWQSLAYGNGRFVAVGASQVSVGAYVGPMVMYSDNGKDWARVDDPDIATNNAWRGVTYGNGYFVAVSHTSPSGSPTVIRSVDGINWDACTPPSNGTAWAVTYGGPEDPLFVAVSKDGSVRTSPDGCTWTNRTSPAANAWSDVTYGNGHFVAVAQTGSGNRVMVSPDGINWGTENSAADNTWNGITYVNLNGTPSFVAVSEDGTERVMLRTGAFLPVTWLEFKGESTDNGVRLRWKTASEQNSSHFEVERSTNGSGFTKVGTVSAAGNSNKIRSYEFVDKTAPTGSLHYRLRQVDIDKRYSYSSTVRVNSTGRASLSIGPNPTSGEATLQLSAGWTGSYECRIISASGAVVYRQAGLRAGSHKIDLSRWSPGLYRVTLWENGETVDQQWIMRR